MESGALEPIGLRAILDDANFQAGLKRYNTGVAQMEKITDSTARAISGAFKLATGALIVGVAGIGAALVTSIKAASDAEQVSAQTDAVLKSTKGVAGVTRQAVDDLARSFSELTPYEDDAIQEGENLLLTFTNIGKNVFPQATETMLDMSRTMKQDLKASAIQLGKALQDPAKGVSALAEVGVNFTESQKKVIEQLVKAGKVEQAQKLILKELQVEFGGAAKAAGKTFNGQLQILQNSLGNVQEEISGAFLPILTRAAGGLTKFLADPKVKVGIKRLTEGIEFITFSFGDIFDLLQGKQGALENLAADLASLGNIIGLDGGTIEKGVTAIGQSLGRLADAVKKGGLGGFIAQLGQEIKTAWPEIQKQFGTWGQGAWDWLTGKGGPIDQAGTKMKEFTTAIGKAATDPENWKKVRDGFLSWKDFVWDWLTNPETGALTNLGKNLQAFSAQLVEEAKKPEVRASIAQFGDELATTIMSVLGDGLSEPDKQKGALMQFAESLGTTLSNLDEFYDIVSTAFTRSFWKALLKKWGGRSDQEAQAIVDFMWPETAAMKATRASQDTGTQVAGAYMTALTDKVEGEQTALDSALSIAIRQATRQVLPEAQFGGNLEGAAVVSGMLGGVYAGQGALTGSMTSTVGNAAAGAYDSAYRSGENVGTSLVSGIIQRLVVSSALIGAAIGTTIANAGAGAELGESTGEGYANGGFVRRTGYALVHKGEYVIPARTMNQVTNNSRTIGQGAVVINLPAGSSLSSREVEAAAYRAISHVMTDA